MVLKVAHALADKFFLYQYAYHILIGLITITVLKALSQGRTTNRERDLHDRTFLVTGGFTPLGLTLLQNLAQRGAKIVALSPYPIDSPAITILVSLLRTTYNNDRIYAERCNLVDPTSIRDFCMRFLTEGEAESDKSKTQSEDKATATSKEKPKSGTDSRLDGIIFAHEYQHIGIPRFLRNKPSMKPTTLPITQDEEEEKQRESSSLATFLITTLLLPALLVAPVERDIRIINVVNPFYAAAAASVRTSKTFNPTFTPLTPISPSTTISSSSSPPSPRKSLFLTEGLRSLRTIIFTRHLQRIFDALPKPQIPKTEEGTSSVPIISARMQRSNIVAVSVSPGICRADTVSRMLNADWSLADGGSEEGSVVERRFSWTGVVLYILLLPVLYVATKSPKAATQSILHSLFLPTPFKVLSQSISESTSETLSQQKKEHSDDTASKQPPSAPPRPKSSSLVREEVLKPGALYAECAVVNLDLSIPSPPPPKVEAEKKGGPSERKGKDKGLKEEVLQITDDGEYGGEVAGRMVWEAYEAALKVWEQSGSEKREKEGGKKDS